MVSFFFFSFLFLFYPVQFFRFFIFHSIDIVVNVLQPEYLWCYNCCYYFVATTVQKGFCRQRYYGTDKYNLFETYFYVFFNDSCWHSLTTIFRRQLNQKIMRVCISYTHLYPIKSLNHTSPSRKYKLCFWANMQVARTFWPDIKSQKISEYRFRLKWTKWSPRTEANPAGAGRASALGQGETKTIPL